jgi:glutathione S-transferase
MSPIILGYWDIRALGHPIRFLLEVAEADYEEEIYSVEGSPPNCSKAKWFALKPSLPLDFPNLPYLYHGEVKITQSLAIMRYLARKFGFDAKSEEEQIRIDLFEREIDDWREDAFRTFYNPDAAKLIDQYKQNLKHRFELFSKFLGDREYVSGGSLSYVDFIAFEWLDQSRYIIPGFIEFHSNIKNYYDRIREIPQMKKYMASDKYIEWPFSNPRAAMLGKFNERPKV